MNTETRWLPPMSRGERDVQNALHANGIEAIREKTFDGLIGLGGGLLRYDFAMPLSGGFFILIYYDSEQHFRPSRWSGKLTQEEAERCFRVQKEHDRMKDEYAENNGHELLRIPYWDRLNIHSIITKYL